MKKFAVVLAGCGRMDGAEINEAVTLLLSLSQQGCAFQCFAPDRKQFHVVDHSKGVVANEERNILVEASRITRDKVLPIDEFKAADYDALVFSGGFGAAKNLCDYAFKGAEMQVMPDVARAINEMHAADKPIGGMCIAPVLFAKLIKDVHITLGNDGTPDVENVRKMGAHHIQSEHGDVVIDHENRVFTTPAFMLDAELADVYDGAYNMVEAIIQHLDGVEE